MIYYFFSIIFTLIFSLFFYESLLIWIFLYLCIHILVFYILFILGLEVLGLFILLVNITGVLILILYAMFFFNVSSENNINSNNLNFFKNNNKKKSNKQNFEFQFTKTTFIYFFQFFIYLVVFFFICTYLFHFWIYFNIDFLHEFKKDDNFIEKKKIIILAMYLTSSIQGCSSNLLAYIGSVFYTLFFSSFVICVLILFVGLLGIVSLLHNTNKMTSTSFTLIKIGVKPLSFFKNLDKLYLIVPYITAEINTIENLFLLNFVIIFFFWLVFTLKYICIDLKKVKVKLLKFFFKKKKKTFQFVQDKDLFTFTEKMFFSFFLADFIDKDKHKNLHNFLKENEDKLDDLIDGFHYDFDTIFLIPFVGSIMLVLFFSLLLFSRKFNFLKFLLIIELIFLVILVFLCFFSHIHSDLNGVIFVLFLLAPFTVKTVIGLVLYLQALKIEKKNECSEK